MEDNDHYKKLIGRLRNTKPEAGDMEERVNNIAGILRSGANRNGVYSQKGLSLFSWAESRIARWGLATAAIILGAFFIIQQLVLLDRINQIESHLKKVTVSGEAPSSNRRDGASRLVMTGLSMGMVRTDSIMISMEDLMLLMNEAKNGTGDSPEFKELLRLYNKSLMPRPGEGSDKVKL